MTINSNKFELNWYQISTEGTSPDNNLINKILEIFTPKYTKEFESFLGLTNFYSKFLPRYSEIVEPFAEIRKRNAEFKWTQR